LAIADFNRALELTPMSAWTIAERGVAYLRSGMFGRAVADLSRALELDDGDAWALYARGVARKKSGDVAGGDADIAAATKLWPNVAAAAAKDGIRP
jgi:Flp pilus assembly protein TadD